MDKGKSKAQMFYSRTGSFSTHGSRSGINLLGWGQSEQLSKVQRVAATNARINQIQCRLGQIKNEIHNGNYELSIIQERNRLIEEYKNLSQDVAQLKGGSLAPIEPLILVATIKARVAPLAFNQFVDEAKERFQAAQSSTSSSPEPKLSRAQKHKKDLLDRLKEVTSAIEQMDERQKTEYIKDFTAFLSERKRLGRELFQLGQELSRLKAISLEVEKRAVNRCLDNYIADVAKERVSKPLWQIIVTEARNAMTSSAAIQA